MLVLVAITLFACWWCGFEALISLPDPNPSLELTLSNPSSQRVVVWDAAGIGLGQRARAGVRVRVDDDDDVSWT